MGKQWSLYNTATSSSTSNKKSAGKSRKKTGSHNMSSSSSSSTFGGCMSAFFHLFDIQNHHLPFHQRSFISESSIKTNIILKGVEAPRNSLELKEQEPATVTEEVSSSSFSSSSSKLKQETNFNLPPMREIQIKTKRSRLTEADISSECSSSSPGTKTPSLVARLMGLDLLPENSSPRPSLSSPRVSSSSSNKYTATRSLPVTPRASSTVPRRSTEVNYHHRLSLQTNKEINKRRYDESSSTSEYAKQIAKQVRENISRRVAGADITNSVKKDEHRRDEYLVVLKPKRSSAATSSIRRGKENIEPTAPLSSSPRLRLLDITNNIIHNKPNYSSTNSEPADQIVDYSSPLVKDEVQVVKPMKVHKCKKLASEKYDLRLKKNHQQLQEDQPAVMKKCSSSNKKSTPLSTHLVKKVNTTTKFISFKKDDMASPPSSSSTTMLPQKQVPLASITQLPSCQSRSYNTYNSNRVRTNGNGVITAGRSVSVSDSDYLEYISTVLRYSGIEKNTTISISNWYSPSHPLHPSIFQQVEKLVLHSNDAVNRRLIFDVADELLVEILKPYISLKPWVWSGQWNLHRRMYGSELVLNVCEKIGGFPAADCQVLEDIDGLIEGDMRRSTRAVGETAFEEVAEEVVAEVEREMVDTLVGEMAAGMMVHVGCGNRV